LIDVWWIAGASAFGFVSGFLTGASNKSGTAKDVVVALLGGGVIGTVITSFNNVDLAGQYLFSFSVVFFVGLVFGSLFRKKKGGIAMMILGPESPK